MTLKQNKTYRLQGTLTFGQSLFLGKNENIVALLKSKGFDEIKVQGNGNDKIATGKFVLPTQEMNLAIPKNLTLTEIV